jgi:hypothetical protein
MSTSDTDIKNVDLRKETLNTVKEAIRIASAINPLEFIFYVNPNFVKNNLITTRIVKVVTEAPAFLDNPIDYLALKNLKNTLDFAKKVLVEDGEAIVVEKAEPSNPVEESSPVADIPEAAETATEETPTETTKKRARKKSSLVAETDSSDASDSAEETE